MQFPVHPSGPAFSVPEFIDLAHPAWIQHTPFMAALVDSLAPRVFVELGVHTGNSYFAACETVARRDLGTRCYAVDTWAGDEHAGFYGDEVFEAVAEQNSRYAFSELVRKRFDEAIDDFKDGSIDLIHFDGRHYFQDIKDDFESWLPKLSRGAVALFHDIHVYENDFGVAQYWAQVRDAYRTFEFHHGHGLGVALIGDQHSEKFLEWFSALESTEAASRAAYFRLGEAVLDHHRVRRNGRFDRDPAALVAQVQQLEAERARTADNIGHLVRQVRETVASRDALRTDLQVRAAASTSLSEQVAELSERVQQAFEQVAASEAGRLALQHHDTELTERLAGMEQELRASEVEGVALRLQRDEALWRFERLRGRRTVRLALAIAARFRWLFMMVRRAQER